MTPENFAFIRELLYSKSGLVLGDEKAYLLENRLMPIVRAYDLEDVDQLVAKLRAESTIGLSDEIVDVMTTNESLFFRDSKPFDQLREISLPYFSKARASSRKLRIWSAAASTGQEAYSISIVCDEEKEKIPGWDVEILGTDLSRAALTRAKSGIYSQFEVQRGLSIQMLLKYFTKEEECWEVNRNIRERVRFEEFNLLESPARLGTFDVIFCRNVLIYFDKKTKVEVLNRVSQVLAPDGILFLGAAETILGLDTPFQPIQGLRGAYGLSEKEAVQDGRVSSVQGALATPLHASP